jgi:hypothetical protein
MAFNKSLLLIAAISAATAFRAEAQSVPAAIAQLAALQTLGTTIQQGYEIATTGLDIIHGFRADEYSLHLGFITRLDTVQPAVTTDSKVQALRTQLAALVNQLQSTLDYWQRQQPVSSN